MVLLLLLFIMIPQASLKGGSINWLWVVREEGTKKGIMCQVEVVGML